MVNKLAYAVPAVLLVLLISGCTAPENPTPFAECDSCCLTCEVCEVCQDCPEDVTPYEACDSCCPEPEEKAMISSVFIDWYVNLYNESELYIEVAVFNYGYKEAKNVEITCKAFEYSSEPIITVKNYVGNIASTSVKEVTIVTEVDYARLNSIFDKYDDESTMGYIVCVPTSCDNCIILDKRIPEFEEYF